MEKSRRRSRELYADHPQSRLSAHRRWLAKPGNREYVRFQRLLRVYGLTREEFEAMLEAQGGACAICQEQLSKPYVDHDHATGEVRALLCPRCNSFVGFLETHGQLDRALLYISNRQALSEPDRGTFSARS